MFIVYVIYNSEHKKFYIGQTSKLEVRIKMHNERKLARSYTARFDGEWFLVYNEHFCTRSEAIKREKQLKSFQGRKFIKKLLPE